MKRAAAALALASACAAAHALPTFVEVKAAHRPSDVTLVDRNGTPIQTVRVDKSVRRLAWTPLAEISPALAHRLGDQGDAPTDLSGGALVGGARRDEAVAPEARSARR